MFAKILNMQQGKSSKNENLPWSCIFLLLLLT